MEPLNDTPGELAEGKINWSSGERRRRRRRREGGGEEMKDGIKKQGRSQQKDEQRREERWGSRVHFKVRVTPRSLVDSSGQQCPQHQ